MPDPRGFVQHTVEVVPEKADHVIVEGLDRRQLDTAQHWVLTDALDDVLATTTSKVQQGAPWGEEPTCPAGWTRQWGADRIFASTMGHKLDDLDHRDERTPRSGVLLWAGR